MEGVLPAVDLARVRRDIDGALVSDGRSCAYCGGTVSIDDSVVVELARFTDDLDSTRRSAYPAPWVADATRCTDCTVEVIEPATAGVDEAVVRVAVTASADHLRLDAGALSLLAHAPPTEGYYPPTYDLNRLLAIGDVGLLRWSRLAAVLTRDERDSDRREHLQEMVSLSRALPPDLA